ncbi:coiled-coil-helix-coiled-coil-helix domain-containing protein 7-like [Amphiura filiformis]|uniref:coiled-coil-helix-coiled-coil-helix domain-containing protein 7-like n=1 Tax=Amphiura filiformis TaxID=82378 RepID=UPI003B21DB03
MPEEEKSKASRPDSRKLHPGVHKMRDAVVNPCIPESDASYKCLNDNNYNRDACSDYFKNYQNCMKFWTKISRQRRWKGIKPHLPPPEERDQILQDMNVPENENL